MTQYTPSQIAAVRELQELHDVPGTLSDDACVAYLDWHMATCTAEARGITSVSEARAQGLAIVLSIHEQQFRKVSELAGQ
jgi:hypothetical protein